MSSTNKTENLQLNRWQGTDVPQRTDFNRDNDIIDSVISAHLADSDRHTAAADKARWNTPYIIKTYTGNGSSSRAIALDSGFEPKWGIVFALNSMPTLTDFNSKYKLNYFGIVSTRGSVLGLSLSGTTLTVQQSAVAVQGNEYKSFNESGMTYCCIMFR